MAVREINLIPSKYSLTPREVVVRRLLAFWTPLILIFYIILMVATLSYNFWLTSQINTTESLVQKEKTLIGEKQQIEGTYLLLRQKLGALQQIVGNRYSFTDVSSWVDSLVMENYTILSVKMAEDGQIAIDLSIRDSGMADILVRKLLDDAQSRFNRVELVNFSQVGDGTYNIVFDIVNKTEQKKVL